MYSPKINEDLVQVLYHLKQKTKRPMTFLVNEAVALYLRKETENEQQYLSRYGKADRENITQGDKDHQTGDLA